MAEHLRLLDPNGKGVKSDANFHRSHVFRVIANPAELTMDWQMSKRSCLLECLCSGPVQAGHAIAAQRRGGACIF